MNVLKLGEFVRLFAANLVFQERQRTKLSNKANNENTNKETSQPLAPTKDFSQAKAGMPVVE